MEVKAEKTKAPRRANARRSDVVLAVIEERLTDTILSRERLTELYGELKRSLKGGKETPEESE